MVTRAVATITDTEAAEDRALDALGALDALTVDGEPVLSAYRSQQDGPWQLDALFVDDDAEARTRWLAIAAELRPELSFEWDPLAERDWVAESQKALHPVRAGRFLVHGSHDSARLPPSRWRLTIDAGRAFGTAHHASTQGCLVALTRLAQRAPLGAVLDVGTGTGVLALAADRLGATSVTAGDVDPEAVAVARRNVAANRSRGAIRVRRASGPFGRADLVIANILARPLIAMAPRIAGSARRAIILSGLRQRDRRRVSAAYLARGFALDEVKVLEDWATITLVRRAARRPTHDGAAGRPHRRGG